MGAQCVYMRELCQGLLGSCWASRYLELEHVVGEGLEALEAPVDPSEEAASGAPQQVISTEELQRHGIHRTLVDIHSHVYLPRYANLLRARKETLERDPKWCVPLTAGTLSHFGLELTERDRA